MIPTKISKLLQKSKTKAKISDRVANRKLQSASKKQSWGNEKFSGLEGLEEIAAESIFKAASFLTFSAKLGNEGICKPPRSFPMQPSMQKERQSVLIYAKYFFIPQNYEKGAYELIKTQKLITVDHPKTKH